MNNKDTEYVSKIVIKYLKNENKKKIDYLGHNWTMFSFRGIFKTDYKIEAFLIIIKV